MKKTLGKTTGIGLAAPQVGYSISLFILDYPFNSKDPVIYLNGKTVSAKDLRGKAFLNPSLELSRGIQTASEGCLSIPDRKTIRVPRYDMVKITFQDETLKTHEIKAQGFFARLIQHEYDHLLGKLITDYEENSNQMAA